MDPKEYAARLQRMRDEMETAKARERIQAQSSRELSPETSSSIEAAMAALREDKAGMLRVSAPLRVKPKAKPAVKEEEPLDGDEMSRRSPRKQVGVPQWLLEREDAMRRAKNSGGGKPTQTPAPTINSVRDTVKPPPAPAPTPAPPAKLSPAQERVKGLTPAQAETILSDAYSTRGKHGQYTQEETELMDALRAKAAGFDYGSVKQAPAVYVPSFLGGKK